MPDISFTAGALAGGHRANPVAIANEGSGTGNDHLALRYAVANLCLPASKKTDPHPSGFDAVVTDGEMNLTELSHRVDGTRKLPDFAGQLADPDDLDLCRLIWRKALQGID